MCATIFHCGGLGVIFARQVNCFFFGRKHVTKTYLHRQQILRNLYRPLNDHINTSISFLRQENIMFVVCICINDPKDQHCIKDDQVT